MHVATLASIPKVADLAWHRGTAAAKGAAPDLVLEVPHGATQAAHFDALRAELQGAYPEDLKDFFFVNTDVGAPEVAERVAALVVEAEPARTALVIRCRLPRTFVDCNRLIDPKAAATTSKAGEMTPGIVGYVKDPRDLALLLERHAQYRRLVEQAFEAACGAGGAGAHAARDGRGEGVMVHSYAPRSIDVAVDEKIVERLREAYRPEQIGRWPLRHEVDLITRTPDGALLASERLVERVRAGYRRIGIEIGENASYGMHPSTTAHALALKHPGRTLCLELRRDLLARAFTPFAEMQMDPAKVERMARPLAEALRR